MHFLEKAKLKDVDISNEDIADGALREICNVLRGNENLATLWLRGDKIGDSGTLMIVDSIKHAPSLVDINLRDNKISDIGAIKLFELASRNPSIKQLNLTSNRITDKGARSISRMLEESKLEAVYLFDNLISKTGERLLQEAARKCKKLEILDIGKFEINTQKQR
jgi:NLR family CARD domain-containing protein 3